MHFLDFFCIYRWYGYSEDGNKVSGFNERDMPGKAVVFMRPRRDTIKVRCENDKQVTKYPKISGFTNGENRKNVRPIKEMVDLLKWLNTDKESFISIVRFLKMNLCK